MNITLVYIPTSWLERSMNPIALLLFFISLKVTEIKRTDAKDIRGGFLLYNIYMRIDAYEWHVPTGLSFERLK